MTDPKIDAVVQEAIRVVRANRFFGTNNEAVDDAIFALHQRLIDAGFETGVRDPRLKRAP